MELRERINEALKTAMRERDATRLSTLRLINAAIKDRDIARRGEGGDGAEDGVGREEILQILGKMVKQRHESARAYEEGGRLELADQERAEITVIEDFLLDPRHGQGHGRAQVEIHRADGFRLGGADGQGAARLSRGWTRAGPGALRIFGKMKIRRAGCGPGGPRKAPRALPG